MMFRSKDNYILQRYNEKRANRELIKITLNVDKPIKNFDFAAPGVVL